MGNPVKMDTVKDYATSDNVGNYSGEMLEGASPDGNWRLA